MSTLTRSMVPAPDIAETVRGISVDPTVMSCTIGDLTLVADNPRELQQKLSSALYERLHAGHGAGVGLHPKNARSAVLEQALRDQVGHGSTVAAGRVATPFGTAGQRPSGAMLVERDGIRIWVPEAAVEGQGAQPGDPVRFRHAAVRTALSPGFLVADASAGVDLAGHVLRLYVHLAEAAAGPAVWGSVLRLLEDAGARYRAKILSGPRLYPRRDALVVYLPQVDWDLVPELAGVLRAAPGLGTETSAFACAVGPGVALALEPRDPDPSRRGLSFGQHRAAVVARAVVTAAESGADAAVVAELSCLDAGIDPRAPFRNVDSPPLPFPTT